MYLLTRVAPVHVASRKGKVTILGLLLDYGANVNAVSSDGKTCLHVLASKCVSTSGDKSFLKCLKRALNEKGVQVSNRLPHFMWGVNTGSNNTLMYFCAVLMKKLTFYHL